MSGARPPLVLLHGVGHSRAAWDPVRTELGRSFEVVALDSPGFGAEPTDRLADGRFDVPAYVDAFVAWLHELGLPADEVAVAGNSMGGAIALELARRRRVRAACALSPAGFWTPAEVRYVQLLLGSIAVTPRPLLPALEAAARSRALRAALFGTLVARPGRMDPDVAAGAVRGVAVAPATLPALRAFADYVVAPDPTLGGAADGPRVTVAWGTKDRLLPYARQAPRARIALPAARHLDLAGLGHVPMTDDPGVVAEVIRRAVAA